MQSKDDKKEMSSSDEQESDEEDNSDSDEYDQKDSESDYDPDSPSKRRKIFNVRFILIIFNMDLYYIQTQTQKRFRNEETVTSKLIPSQIVTQIPRQLQLHPAAPEKYVLFPIYQFVLIFGITPQFSDPDQK